MNSLGLKKVTFYIIRHKATGKVMPQLRGKGYSFWNPASNNPMNDLVKKDLGVPRLLPSYDTALRVISQWNALPNAYNKYTTSYFGEGEYALDIRPDGRKKEDLEIIKIRIVRV